SVQAGPFAGRASGSSAARFTRWPCRPETVRAGWSSAGTATKPACPPCLTRPPAPPRNPRAPIPRAPPSRPARSPPPARKRACGRLWLWDVRPGRRNQVRRLRPPAREPNPVRLVAFLGPARCLTVSRDGAVQEWDLGGADDAERPVPEPKLRGRFEGTELFAV